MISDSVALMTVIDIVIMATAAASIVVIRRQSPALEKLDLLLAARVLSFGISAIGLFYFVDLFSMWGLPLFVGESRARAFMEDLHLSYSWGLMLAIIGCVAVCTYLVRESLKGAGRLHREIEQGRREFEEHLKQEKALADGQRIAHVGSWEWNIPTDTLSWSDEHSRIFGYEPGTLELTHESFLAAVHPEDRDRVASTVRAAVVDRDAYELNYRVVRPDGSQRVLHAEAEVRRDSSGDAVAVFGIVLDVTEREEAAEALRASEERVLELNRDLEQRVERRTAELTAARQELERVFELSIDLIGIVTLEGLFVRINPAFETFLGYGEGELLGKSYLDFLHPDDRERAREIGASAVDAREDVLDFEARYRHKDGSYRWLRWNARAAVEEGVSYGIGRDVTEEKLDAEELRRHRDELKVLVQESTAELRAASEQQAATTTTLRALTMRLRQVREEERTGLARELHDELGQALTSVNIDLGWLGQKLEDRDSEVQERVRALTGLIREMIGSIQRISNELRPPVLDDLGLFDAIDWYVETFAQRNGVEASFDLSESTPELKGDPATAVFRVVQEALTNVARHAGASEVTVAVDSSDDVLSVRVLDDGCGIRSEAASNDLSLGLIGMKERAAVFGGAVQVKRRASEGTEVVMTVPLASSNGSARE